MRHGGPTQALMGQSQAICYLWVSITWHICVCICKIIDSESPTLGVLGTRNGLKIVMCTRMIFWTRVVHQVPRICFEFQEPVRIRFRFRVLNLTWIWGGDSEEKLIGTLYRNVPNACFWDLLGVIWVLDLGWTRVPKIRLEFSVCLAGIKFQLEFSPTWFHKSTRLFRTLVWFQERYTVGGH